MEFLIVPFIFGTALLLLSVGKFFGKKEGVQMSCSASKKIHSGPAESCATCACEEAKFKSVSDEEGFSDVARLGYPNRKSRFLNVDKLRRDGFN
jgi:hypothetical protein